MALGTAVPACCAAHVLMRLEFDFRRIQFTYAAGSPEFK
jgi:hypothetical protein